MTRCCQVRRVRSLSRTRPSSGVPVQRRSRVSPSRAVLVPNRVRLALLTADQTTGGGFAVSRLTAQGPAHIIPGRPGVLA